MDDTDYNALLCVSVIVNFNALSSCHPGNRVQFISVSRNRVMRNYEIPDEFSDNRILGITVNKMYNSVTVALAIIVLQYFSSFHFLCANFP